MRKIFLFQNVSLDGYFEDAQHDFSWANPEPEAFSRQGSGAVDTILLGRKTYEIMKMFWPTPMAEQTNPDIARFMNENQKVVVSHQVFDPGWKNVTLIYHDVPEQIRQLKEQPGKDIIMFGSNTLCVSLMQAGLVDEFQIMLNPVALGAGTPLFAGLPEKAALTLKDTHRFPSGTLLLTYVPRG